MRESRLSGSVEGVMSDHDSYSDYVDEVISRDNFFHKIFPVAQKTGHVRATLVGNAEFLKRF
jgi:hypothetical protein